MPEPPNSGVWQYLKDYGVVEAILAIFTIVLGWVAFIRASSDKRSGATGSLGMPINGAARDAGGGMNQYVINEMMQVMRDLKEESRERNRILERINERVNTISAAQVESLHVLRSVEDILKSNLDQERQQTQLLEDMRNNLVLRGDIVRRR